MTSESTEVQETKWPESAPSAHNDHFFSISCGNSWLHWSFHSGMDKGGQPVLFWRTPLMNSEVIDAGDLVESLAEHLPKVEPQHATNGCSYYPRDHIFGKKIPPSAQAAIKESDSRGAKTSVYIVSSNDTQVDMLSKLFSNIPSRVFRMKGDDFFSTSEGRYEGMGLDRLAALSGAAHLHGFPALVFDCGTASTYTAADPNGHILGGGISPGLSMRFQSLSERTYALPRINLDNFLAELQAKSNEKKPISVFAKNTKDSIIMCALSEMSNNARCVITRWLEEVGQPKQKHVSSQKQDLQNTRRSVLVTGGGAAVIEMLLKPNCGGLIESSMPGKELNVKVMQVNNLIHFGITRVLLRYSKPLDKTESIDNASKEDKPSRKRTRVEADEDSQETVGCRVAKHFGDDLFLGRITKCIKGSGLWHVKYDDGDEEDFDVKEFNAAKELFSKEILKKGKK